MPSGASQLLRSAPYFPVADVGASARYYARVFGFDVEYAGGSPPQFAIVSRDGLAVMLRRVSDPSLIVPNEKQGGTWDAFFWVRDADALLAELRSNGADVVYETIVREYDMREFAVRDGSGYVLAFGQDVGPSR
jgi:predicted enzyme related to lactoylglutathione lyase